MDTVWIQIFILTFAECVAPAGKSVCQAQQFELEFASREACESAMLQLIDVKDQLDYVIVDRAKTRCAPSARETRGFESVDAINAANEDQADWRAPSAVEARRRVSNASHQTRLGELKPCEETNGAAPCRIGEIIVEEATGDSVEVWRRD